MDALIEKYLNASITKEEELVLYEWLQKDADNIKYFKAKIAAYSLEHQTTAPIDSKKTLEKIMAKINPTEKMSKVRLLRPLLRYAAIFIVLFGLGYVFTTGIFKEENVRTQTVVSSENSATDTNNIILKLANGTVQQITEDTAELSFLKNEENTAELAYNELVVPKGEVFKLTLSDSTVVWLNADSKLRFPKQFIDGHSTRKVTLEGEAYFDVAHDANRPFIVESSDVAIQVLGTEFNVTSYDNQETIETTLVEGSVKVNELGNPENQLLISPNQQASFNRQVGQLTAKKVDVGYYTAWMQRRIVFQDLSFEKILEKIERVYNVKIENNRTALNQKKFTGEFDIENINVIFKALSTTIPFEYEINDKKVTIKK